MTSALEIHVDRAVIRGGSNFTGEEGIFAGEAGLQGWEGIPSRRREQVARAVEHGEHDSPVYLGSRTVTIDGWIVASSEGKLRSYSQIVTGIGAFGDRVMVSIRHQGENLHGLARVVSAEVTDSGYRGRQAHASFQLQFVFADPRKYGDVLRAPESGSANTAVAFHYGNFPAHPVIEVASAPASWSVSSPGGTLQVVSTAGGTHRFDMRTGRLTRNGVDVTDSSTITGDMWAVPVGARWTHTFSGTGRVFTPTTFI